MSKSETYIVEDSIGNVYSVVQREMDKALFNKKYNLSGKIGENGGLDLYPKLFFAKFEPNLGPMAKIHLSGVPVHADGSRSKLNMERKNGLTYKLHVGFVITISLGVILIAGIYTLMELQKFDIKILWFPLFGFFYFIMIEGFTGATIYSTRQRVLKILSDNKIKYTKQ